MKFYRKAMIAGAALAALPGVAIAANYSPSTTPGNFNIAGIPDGYHVVTAGLQSALITTGCTILAPCTDVWTFTIGYNPPGGVGGNGSGILSSSTGLIGSATDLNFTSVTFDNGHNVFNANLSQTNVPNGDGTFSQFDVAALG
ncbi:MAG: hypothetical protein ACK2T2_13705, partial [Anaerolineales bacterium]